MRNIYKILVEKPERKILLMRPESRWGDAAKIDLRHRVRRCGLASTGSGYGPVTGTSERGKGLSVPLKGKELFDFLSGYQLLKKDCVAWG